MKFKKPLSLLLAGALAASLCVLPSTAATFTDTVGHSAEEAIDQFAALGILQGYGDGTFDPERSITRGDLCTILSRVFIFTEAAENTFTDLDETRWYAQPMLQLNAAGIIQGYGNGLIKPLNTITWEEALVMIARAFGLKESFMTTLPYEDRGEISDWAFGYVTTMYAKGFLHGEPLLGPGEPFTRADTVTILSNVIDRLGWEAAGKTLVDGVLVPLEQDPSEEEAPGEEVSGEELPGEETTEEELPDSDRPVIDTEGHSYPYDPNHFITIDGRTYYMGDELTPAYGIDVSTHQGEIDWQAVAGDGVEFAMIRLGYRGYTAGSLNLDARFVQNIEGALEAGLKVGVYFFSQAITVEEAIEEAQFVLDALEPYAGLLDFPVVFDWEDIGTTTARTYKLDTDILNACALAFCGEIEAAGYEPMIYFYPNLGAKRYR